MILAIGVVLACAALEPHGDDVELMSSWFVQQVRWELAGERRTLSASEFAACVRSRAEPTANGVLLAPAGAGLAAAASIDLPVHRGPAFRDALASWNARVPDGMGLIVDLRVAPADGPWTPAAWSPWLELGDWGAISAESTVMSFEGGRVHVDEFRSERRWAQAQLRVRAWRTSADATARVTLERVTLCLSDRTTPHRVAWDRFRPSRSCSNPAPRGPFESKRRDVPFRSQRTLSAELAPRACSPTSLAMVLAYRGVDRPTEEVAALVYDREHSIYGNWTRAIQGAFTLGVPGYLTRFSSWDGVEDAIRTGQPLVISIATRKGELPGAPYEATDGHLLVLCGFDERGDVLVNDPAATDAATGQRTYSRKHLERCWFDHGGVAYVLEPLSLR